LFSRKFRSSLIGDIRHLRHEPNGRESSRSLQFAFHRAVIMVHLCHFVLYTFFISVRIFNQNCPEIRVRIRVKSWIRMKVKKNCELQRLTMGPWGPLTLKKGSFELSQIRITLARNRIRIRIKVKRGIRIRTPS
jgi:hypothetical protein